MYKINEFAKLINRCVTTLQRWDNAGVLVAKRNPKGRRYYTHDQYLEYIGHKNVTDLSRQNITVDLVMLKQQICKMIDDIIIGIDQ